MGFGGTGAFSPEGIASVATPSETLAQKNERLAREQQDRLQAARAAGEPVSPGFVQQNPFVSIGGSVLDFANSFGVPAAAPGSAGFIGPSYTPPATAPGPGDAGFIGPVVPTTQADADSLGNGLPAPAPMPAPAPFTPTAVPNIGDFINQKQLQQQVNAATATQLAPLRKQRQQARRGFTDFKDFASKLQSGLNVELEGLREAQLSAGADIVNIATQRAQGTQQQIADHLSFLRSAFGPGAGQGVFSDPSLAEAQAVASDVQGARQEQLAGEARIREAAQLQGISALQTAEAKRQAFKSLKEQLGDISGEIERVKASKPLVRKSLFSDMLKDAAIQAEFGLQKAQLESSEKMENKKLQQQQQQFNKELGLKKGQQLADNSQLQLSYGKIAESILYPSSEPTTAKVAFGQNNPDQPINPETNPMAVDEQGNPKFREVLVPGGSPPKSKRMAIARLKVNGVPAKLAKKIVNEWWSDREKQDLEDAAQSFRETILGYFTGGA